MNHQPQLQLTGKHNSHLSKLAPKLRRASSKVFAQVQHNFSSGSGSGSLHPPLPSPSTSPILPSKPLDSNPRRDSMNSSDYEPITSADTRSFEDDGQEGSLQDALDHSENQLNQLENTSPQPTPPEPSELPLPSDTPRSIRTKNTKPPKPGKQHGATSYPASPTSSLNHHHRHQSITSPSKPALPSERSQYSLTPEDEPNEIRTSIDHFRNAPSPSALRRPRQPTSPTFRHPPRESTLSIVAGGHAALPSRLSGWFQQAFSTSSTHLPILSTPSSPSAIKPPTTIGSPEQSTKSGGVKKKPMIKTYSPTNEDPGKKLIFVDPKRSPGPTARGIGNFFDKAVNYMFDTDAFAYDTRLSSDMWIMGGQQFSGGWKWDQQSTIDHLTDENIGWSGSEASHQPTGTNKKRTGLRRVTTNKAKGFFKHTTSNDHSTSTLDSESQPKKSKAVTFSPSASPSPEPALLRRSTSEEPSALSLPSTITHMYPPLFYHAFTSVIGLTYRSDFPPIPCTPDRLRGTGLSAASTRMGGMLASLSLSIGRGGKKSKSQQGDSRSPSPNLIRTIEEETEHQQDGGLRGLTTDAGWGCMLRTGQSLLANAILVSHLGRDWRRPILSLLDPSSNVVPDPAYARLMSWFIDSSSPLAPFSVHRFVSKGKELGKEVGEWFGPSTAAGAIKALTNEFVAAGVGVASDIDGTVYRSDVFQSSILPGSATSKATGIGNRTRSATVPKLPFWQRPVLVLINVRLGLDRVNPSYYETIKATFTFPQSVGIAGGRPSQSYYFCGYQDNSLFYIDPHHPCPAIPLEEPPGPLVLSAQRSPLIKTRIKTNGNVEGEWEQVSTDTDSLTSTSSEPPKRLGSSKHPSISSSSGGTSSTDRERLEEFYSRAYSDTSLRTFHPEKVRRMTISAMDPSMLVGFLVRDEADWEDLTRRIRSFKPPLFHIADVTPAWMKPSTGRESTDFRPSDDSDLGVDSWSDNEAEEWGTTNTNKTQEDHNEDLDDSSFDSHHAPSDEAEAVADGEGEEEEEWDEMELPVPNPTATNTEVSRSDTLRANKFPESLDLSKTITSKNSRPRNSHSRLSSDELSSSCRPRVIHKPSRSLSHFPSPPPLSSSSSSSLRDEPRSRNVSAATVRATKQSDGIVEQSAEDQSTDNAPQLQQQRRRLDSLHVPLS
ncbi:hypothetical protein CROQUDRAFT_97666 [Cronartium quercuum f. sp. fusiforme G11]|uniref:Autophagy-related protein 4 n=1 Tax=Cronartium quercuum f. sp. fusiforme G11 TaxID=708437 RepID=A0A9P6T7U6_9BASI|nr:hypothetical protein CROQUDRAFT_97666 [Cronartium quercuum f. sp. fusiforme G11]